MECSGTSQNNILTISLQGTNWQETKIIVQDMYPANMKSMYTHLK